MADLIQTTIGPLKCLRTQSSDPAVAVVLFHGYGANCEDLAPLRSYLELPKNTEWVFPDGIIEVMVGPMFTGRAWFNIDMDAVEAAMRKGEHRNLTEVRPEGLDYAIEQAQKFWDVITSQYDKVILGGFSQGAMLATELALISKTAPQALVLLSGVMLSREKWQSLNPTNSFPVFQSHGKNDPLLSFKGAETLHQFLKTKELPVEFQAFVGGHEIPPAILQKLSAFVQTQVS